MMKFRIRVTDYKGESRMQTLPWNLLTAQEKFDAVAVPVLKIFASAMILGLGIWIVELAKVGQ